MSYVAEPGSGAHHPNDKGYKFLLSSKQVFLELLRCFVKKGWVNQIDEQSLTRIDKSYILSDFREKEADLVYQVKIQGQEVIFFLLLELQSTVDFQMPYRLLLYLVEIWRDFVKNIPPNEVERKEFLLPSVVPLVLYNGEAPWTAKQTFGEYLSGGELFEEYILNFRYFLIDVHRYTEAELLTLSNLIGAVFYLDQKTTRQELIPKLRKIMGAMRSLSPEHSQLLKVWVVNILKTKLPVSTLLDIDIFLKDASSEEVNTMINNLERSMEEWVQEAKKKGIEEGEKRGEERGEERGEKRGRKEGEKRGKRTVAREMLRKGMDEALIGELTGLTRDEIKKIKEEKE